jgi:hypothetical protein
LEAPTAPIWVMDSSMDVTAIAIVKVDAGNLELDSGHFLSDKTIGGQCSLRMLLFVLMLIFRDVGVSSRVLRDFVTLSRSGRTENQCISGVL